MELRPAEPGIESVYACLKSTKVCIGLGLFVLGDHWLCVSSYHGFFCPYRSIEVDISFTVFCHKPSTLHSPFDSAAQSRQADARTPLARTGPAKTLTWRRIACGSNEGSHQEEP